MIQVVLTAVGVFVSTSIDYLFILIILFAQKNFGTKKGQIYAGQFLGTGLLVGISLVAVYIVNFLPEQWMIGLLGLVPIYLGIRFAIVGEEDEEEEEIIHTLEERGSNQLFWTVTLLTIASGGDNLGIYIPYFASLSWLYIGIALIVFSIGIIVLCELSHRLSSLPGVSETIEKYEHIIIPLVFIPLGIYILLENGTLHYFWNVIM